MRRPSLISTLCCAIAVFAAVAQPLKPFTVSVREVRDPENGVFTEAALESNGERFSVVVPRGWRSSLNQQESSLSLYAGSDGTPITLSFSPNAAPATLTADALRQTAAPFLKDPIILKEFPAYTGYGPGGGADFSFTLQDIIMRSRIVIIPLAQGHVSFVLSCSAAQWEQAQQSLGTTLTSFRRASENAPKEYVSSEAPWPRENREQAAAPVGITIPGLEASRVPEELAPPPKPSIFEAKEIT